MDAKFTSWYTSGQYHLAISHLGNSCFTAGMEVNEIRQRRTRQLIEQRFKGVDAALARALDMQPSQVARWFMDDPKHHRNIGERVARRIEHAAEVPPGWLDQDATDLPAQEELPLYSTTPDLQRTVLGLFECLTYEQQLEQIEALKALKKANETVVRQLSGRLKLVTRERAAKHLPPAPKKDSVKS